MHVYRHTTQQELTLSVYDSVDVCITTTMKELENVCIIASALSKRKYFSILVSFQGCFGMTNGDCL